MSIIIIEPVTGSSLHEIKSIVLNETAVKVTREYIGGMVEKLETLRAELETRRATNAALTAALEEIRTNYGHVCQEFETCDHPACASSYGAWAVADETLRKSPPTEMP